MKDRTQIHAPKSAASTFSRKVELTAAGFRFQTDVCDPLLRQYVNELHDESRLSTCENALDLGLRLLIRQRNEVAVVHLTDLVRDPRVIEDALGGGRLPGIDVRHDADVSRLLQRYLPWHDLFFFSDNETIDAQMASTAQSITLFVFPLLGPEPQNLFCVIRSRRSWGKTRMLNVEC